ncbi:hypothetical protein M405DRAFT_264114, partial [Rhizopogon salebrosus TDB-379]
FLCTSSSAFSVLCKYVFHCLLPHGMTLFSSPSYTTMPRNRAVRSQRARVLRSAQCTCQCHFV